MINILCRSLLLLLLHFGALHAEPGEYVGAEACRSCHESQFDVWKGSHHRFAMQPANAETVKGRFDDQTLEFHGVRSVMGVVDGRYEIETDTDKGRERVAVKYTFGSYPLQQYLIERDRGHLQALNLAWDDRPAAVGGQRWYHLRDELEEGSPFFWTRHLQNWNAGCAECHSTGLKTNYDGSRRSYETTFAAVNVSCEACHGPAKEHVATARAGKPSALVNSGPGLIWSYEDAASIASAKGTKDFSYLDMCGGCHSRRSVLGEIHPGRSFRQQFQISFLEEGLYFSDGQIDDEVFVLGSFMQSRMYQEGVTCMDCHDAHSGAVKYSDNRLCGQCHNPAGYDIETHAGHTNVQAQCVDCHMPERTYMGVDNRRDHQFGIPDPHLADELGLPHACTGCHADKPPNWAMEQTKPRSNTYARLTASVRRHDPDAVSAAIDYIRDTTNPVIRRATLLAGLPLTSDAASLSVATLRAPDPMLREAASRLLVFAPENIRYDTLSMMAGDPDKAVRLNIARAMAPVLSRLPLDQVRPLLPLISELQASLRPDRVADLTSLAALEVQLGRAGKGREIFRQALAMEPHYIPALLNLADLERHEDEAASRALLLKATELAPDSGAAMHSYGLALVRDKRVEEAVVYLARALEQADAIPRYAYVYAVALDNVGKTEKSLAALEKALEKWPNQSDLASLMTVYRRKIR